MRICEGE